MSSKTVTALTIATSDPSGGAGIQADVKAFSAMGAYGTAVLVALTAQNTHGVSGIHTIPPSFIRQQLDTLFEDVRIDAVKIGMLANAETVATVAEALKQHQPPFVVLDPVMVAASGDRLLEAEAVTVLRETLLPKVDLVTPNLPEAADLLDEAPVADEEAAERQGKKILDLGVPRALIKGGHRRDASESTDLLVDEAGALRLAAPRVDTKHSHGTGCTLSSAIAALRPQAADWPTAIFEAKTYVSAALATAEELDIGTGNGPLNHFHAWWNRDEIL